MSPDAVKALYARALNGSDPLALSADGSKAPYKDVPATMTTGEWRDTAGLNDLDHEAQLK